METDRNPTGVKEEDPDLRLVMAVKDGDREAFEEIVKKYQGPAFNIALRMLSDREEARDLTQEVFIKIYRSIGSFRSESRFSRWFYTILLNTCRSRLKHLKRRGFFRSEPLDNPGTDQDERPPRQWADDSPDSSRLLEKKEMAEIVQEKIKLVPEEFRQVLILRDIQGFSYEEISELLGIADGTVKSRLHRGRMALKSFLEKDIRRLI
jgi:RNA polymerase sigma-70 factor (ECF subfamily)